MHINRVTLLQCQRCDGTDALEWYSSHLSAYELDEIQNYREVWFLGLDAEKVKAVTGAALNNGFDDQHGSYTKVSYYPGTVVERWSLTSELVRSTCSRRVTTYVGKLSAIGQPTRPTQFFIL